MKGMLRGPLRLGSDAPKDQGRRLSEIKLWAPETKLGESLKSLAWSPLRLKSEAS